MEVAAIQTKKPTMMPRIESSRRGSARNSVEESGGDGEADSEKAFRVSPKPIPKADQWAAYGSLHDELTDQ